MTKKLALLLLVSTSGLAQVGIGTVAVNNDAILELKSDDDNKGLLLSQAALVTLASPAPFASHVQGMTVYNTAVSATDPDNVFPGVYYNDGTSWKRMAIGADSPTLGDLKQSVLTADHDGWYLMDGRTVTLLPTAAQTNAAMLGFTNLPDADDRILKGRSSTEDFADLGGVTSFTLAQANLPNITYTGNTSSAGAHTHGFTNRGANYWNYNAGAVGGLRLVNGATVTTGSAGAHTHTVTVPLGGSNTAVTFRPKYIVSQTFIYLGN